MAAALSARELLPSNVQFFAYYNFSQASFCSRVVERQAPSASTRRS